jgi:hypothetical protein
MFGGLPGKLPDWPSGKLPDWPSNKLGYKGGRDFR